MRGMQITFPKTKDLKDLIAKRIADSPLLSRAGSSGDVSGAADASCSTSQHGGGSMRSGSEHETSQGAGAYRNRVERFEQELSSAVVDLKQLRRLSFQGVPDGTAGGNNGNSTAGPTAQQPAAGTPQPSASVASMPGAAPSPSPSVGPLTSAAARAGSAAHGGGGRAAPGGGGRDVVTRQRDLRPVVWKLLLGYLPPERARWDAELAAKRRQYAQFCQELILDPKDLHSSDAADPPLLADASMGTSSILGGSRETAAGGGEGGSAACSAGAMLWQQDLALAAAEVTHADHPLSQQSDSKWATYFKDAQVLEQIERDVTRTHPDMHFFSGQDGAAVLHRAEMKRALFLFAKLNPGLTYVQGMNELYAPLYYIFKRDPTPGCSSHAEADAFFCFVDLISEFRDNYCQQLDNSTMGIRAALTNFSRCLSETDQQIADHLDAKGVKPQFYAFRWITLLLTQEFAFPDVLRLWDTLLSDPAGRTDCLTRLCLAMLLHVRAELLAGDMATCIKLLQRYPPVDVAVLLHRAAQLNLPPC